MIKKKLSSIPSTTKEEGGGGGEGRRQGETLTMMSRTGLIFTVRLHSYQVHFVLLLGINNLTKHNLRQGFFETMTK
jgi:hypothetical protein